MAGNGSGITITPSDPLAKFLPPVTVTFLFCWPKDLSPREKNASTKMVPFH